MQRAWAGPPPRLPSEWASASYLESHDIFVAINGRRWHDVGLSLLPNYFYVLPYLASQMPEAGGYYLASFLRLYFVCATGEIPIVENSLEFFLSSAVENPTYYNLTRERCLAVDQFLQTTAGHIEWLHPPDLVDLWSKSLSKQPDSSKRASS